jgi:hypothetical protein
MKKTNNNGKTLPNYSNPSKMACPSPPGGCRRILVARGPTWELWYPAALWAELDADERQAIGERQTALMTRNGTATNGNERH